MRKNFIISKLIVCFLVISLMFSLQAMMNSDSTDAPLYVPTFSSAASDSSANMPGKFDFSSADDQAVQVVEVGTQVDTIGEDESWSECDEEPCVLQNEEAEGLVDRKSVGVQAGKGGLSEIPPVDCKYDCDREFQLLLDLILACKGLGAKDVFGNEKIKSDIFNILSRAFNNYALPDMLGLGVGFPEQGTVVVEFFSFLSFRTVFWFCCDPSDS